MSNDKISVLFEDKDYVIIEKPSGLDSEHDVVSILLKDRKEVYCVHRLDKVVSGVMVYAKNKKTAAYFSEIIQSHEFKKEYTLLCEGEFLENSGDMEDFLFKDSKKNKSFVVKRERKGVKKASLSYEVLKTVTLGESTVSLVRVKLHTGRFHQIRTQFSSRKHPIVGDGKYGSRISYDGICLHSSQISFPDWNSKEMKSFSSEPKFME